MLDEVSDADENLEADVLRLTRQTYTHMIASLLLLFVGAGASLGAVMLLSSLITSADQLLSIKPETRADSLSKHIAATRSKAERDYAALEARMDDESIFAINKKFKVMYDISLQNERSYGEMLDSYQQASFNIASRIRGSGEWYFYYERDLMRLIKQQQNHEASMAQYLSSLESQ